MQASDNENTSVEHEGVFHSLRNFNYRLWAAGFAVSSIGTWMQRTAMDWLVLTKLSNANASVLGTILALQFLPMLLFLPFTGAAADRFDRRKLLYITQSALAILSFGIGILTISGAVQLWQCYLFAFTFGTVVAFDTPARQSFISELVPDSLLPNAVALNSASFSLARMIGPAIAGVLIAKFGSGHLFVLNGVSFFAVLASLFFLKTNELGDAHKAKRGSGSMSEGLKYVWETPALLVVFVMLFFIGTFGINFPIFISTMSIKAYHAGPAVYGFLGSMMGIGAVVGALMAAKRKNADVRTLTVAAGIFGIGFTIAAFMPSYTLFGLTLILIGAATQTFTATANSNVQLSTVPSMRGRIMSFFTTLTLGSTPIGAPIVGYIADRFGPRMGLAVGALAGFAALFCGSIFLNRSKSKSNENGPNI